jgi:uncharacterized protein
MLPDITQGGWQAFLVGLIVSPHCVGMCGPLYCSLISIAQSKESGPSEYQQLAYHAGRVLAYTTLGMLAGAISLYAYGIFSWTPFRFLPWLLILLLLIFALRLDRWLPKARLVPREASQLMLKRVRRLPAIVAGLAMGVCSPLLPCAPLYSVLWVCLLAGSPVFGAQLMLGFSLGTIPLLWLSQSQFLRHQAKWSSKRVQWIQRSLAALAALILIVRLLAIGDPASGNACLLP